MSGVRGNSVNITRVAAAMMMSGPMGSLPSTLAQAVTAWGSRDWIGKNAGGERRAKKASATSSSRISG